MITTDEAVTPAAWNDQRNLRSSRFTPHPGRHPHSHGCVIASRARAGSPAPIAYCRLTNSARTTPAPTVRSATTIRAAVHRSPVPRALRSAVRLGSRALCSRVLERAFGAPHAGVTRPRSVDRALDAVASHETDLDARTRTRSGIRGACRFGRQRRRPPRDPAIGVGSRVSYETHSRDVAVLTASEGLRHIDRHGGVPETPPLPPEVWGVRENTPALAGTAETMVLAPADTLAYSLPPRRELARGRRSA